MVGSSNSGRFHAARSIMSRWAGGGLSSTSVDKEDTHFSYVSVTKAAIWGQTRGCLEEQRITPIEGDEMNDMMSW